MILPNIDSDSENKFWLKKVIPIKSLVKFEIDLDLLQKGKTRKKVWVKPTATKKGYYREQEVGQKEIEKKPDIKEKYYPEMSKYLNNLGDESSEVESTIFDYTRSDYIGVNRYMRTGIMPMDNPNKDDYNKMSKKMDIISKFLETAPKLRKGTEVYRGVNFNDIGQYDKFMEKMKVGSVTSMRGYTSCSKTDEILMDFMGITSETPSVVLIIKSLTGVYLDGLSNVPSEKEVLISDDAAYKIENISKSGNVTTITLSQYK